MTANYNIAEKQIWAQFILKEKRSADVEKTLRATLDIAQGDYTELRTMMLGHNDKASWRAALVSTDGFQDQWKTEFFKAALGHSLGSSGGIDSKTIHEDTASSLDQNSYFTEFGVYCIEWVVGFLADRLWSDKGFRSGTIKADGAGSNTMTDLGPLVNQHLVRAFPEAKVYAAMTGAGAFHDGNSKNMIESIPGFLRVFRTIASNKCYAELLQMEVVVPSQMAREIYKRRNLETTKCQSAEYIEKVLGKYFGCTDYALTWPTMYCVVPDQEWKSDTDIQSDTEYADIKTTCIERLLLEGLPSMRGTSSPTESDPLVAYLKAWLIDCKEKLKNQLPECDLLVHNDQIEQFNEALALLKSRGCTGLPKRYARRPDSIERTERESRTGVERALKWLAACAVKATSEKYNSPVSGEKNV